jgi:uncharacterized membrane protein YdjX (TVP38/TMEM64 family)
MSQWQEEARPERRRVLGIPWRTIGAAAALVAFVAAARLLPLAEWVRSFQAWIAGLGAAGVLMFAALYILGALLLGPVWLLTVVAGLTYPLLPAVALVSAVSTLAAAFAFLIARHFARSRVEQLIRRDDRLAAVDRAVGRQGWKVVFLLRLSPVVPYAASNYLYGVTAIAFRPFLLASWIGMLPGTFLYVSLGAAGRVALRGGGSRTSVQWAALGAGLVATVAVTVWIARLAKKELVKSRVEAAEEAS